MDCEIIKELRFGILDGYRLAGMGEPWASKIGQTHDLLKANAIGAILTLTEDDLYGNQHVDAGFLHFHEPIEDCDAPTKEGMNRAIGFISTCIDRGIGVAVHCFEGRGRTGTVLAGWLGIRDGLNAEGAVSRIHVLRPHTVLTPSQREFLKAYLG